MWNRAEVVIVGSGVIRRQHRLPSGPSRGSVTSSCLTATPSSDLASPRAAGLTSKVAGSGADG